MKTVKKVSILVVGRNHKNEPVKFRMTYNGNAPMIGLRESYTHKLGISPAPGIYLTSSLVRIYFDDDLVCKTKYDIRDPNYLEEFLLKPEEDRIGELISVMNHHIKQTDNPLSSLLDAIKEGLGSSAEDMGNPIPGEPGIRMFKLSRKPGSDPVDSGGIN